MLQTNIKNKKRISINEGDGYWIRGTRCLTKAKSTLIVVIEWIHPNTGYYADACIYVKTMHFEWQQLNFAAWTQQYKTPESFIQKYPTFESLFDDTDIAPSFLAALQRLENEKTNGKPSKLVEDMKKRSKERR